MPPYEVLDVIIARYMENDATIESIAAAGFERTDVVFTARFIKMNEYIRRQATVGVRATRRSFDSNWCCRIAKKFPV